MGDSVQVAPLVSNRRGGLLSVLPLWQVAVLLLLIAWLYGSILVRLFAQWMNDPNFSHGIFVPLFSGFVLWQNRSKLSKIEPVPLWAGVFLVIGALLMIVLGDLGAELFFARVSFLVMLAGLIVLFLGWEFFRAMLFPWAFLALMIPIPVLIFQKITFPLQMLAAQLASALLPLLDVPVLREGNLITLPSMPLEVAQACSGIRSLLSLITLAIIYGYLMDNRQWVRALLTITAVPIAVVANSMRIVLTGLLVQYWGPEKGEGFYHSSSGWVIFVISLILLFAVHQIVDRLAKRKTKVTTSAAFPIQASTASSKIPTVAPQGSSERTGTSKFLIIAILAGFTAALLQVRTRNEVFPPREPLNDFPAQFGPWTSREIPIDQQTRDILGAGEFMLRDFINQTDPQPTVGLFIAYFRSQRSGDTIHSPNHCLPGAGWVPTERKVIAITRPDGTTFPANRYVISKAGERALVLYWFLAHDRAVASEYWAKYYLVADSIKLNRSDGALVRLITPMYDRESPDEAEQRLLGFNSQILPVLNTYIPR